MSRRKEDALKDFLWRVGFAVVVAGLLALLLMSGVLHKVTQKAAEHIAPIPDPNKIVERKKK